MILKGSSYKIGDDVNTDYIISGRYKFAISDMKELAKHILEDIDPAFYSRLKPGESFLVAGKNFGMGSSREQAPLVIKEAGIVGVVAKSFARIFYRNAINIGLPLVETDTDGIAENDKIGIDLENGILKNLTKKSETKIDPLPPVMRKLLSDGGLVEHFKKHGGIKL
ncbi:MAG: 3-isopropylmalate dehydratase [Candidatus Omnitrophica bacterium CG1_02_44_16]|nr:MAG: 3-isopropylmalate dehydratase [Candidatus Omnitrophica bacterium CG1_02_44_16]PIY82794.1 MAG: 3-isopropylmalate dehydratase [Candidatus Omnitrophica bacterium CG_4_10_14_0_8_um_filter_44_12]PIZ84041.1 MAG: 3-isopropylmalate dehydratase [Candidatus Omnitrophica bacterium CG_4_10_14_0_2_um_filter_44_9]